MEARSPVQASGKTWNPLFRILLSLLVLVGLAGSAWAAGAPIPPVPQRWATDTVGFLSAGKRAQLDLQLQAYEKQSGHQVLVWIGDTLAGDALDDWAVRTFQAWKVGRKGIDDGVVMFIHSVDRTIDIEVGYGLEGDLTDALASRVIRDVMAPRLRANDPDGAVQAGVNSILSILEGKGIGGTPVAGAGSDIARDQQAPAREGRPRAAPKEKSWWVPILLVVGFIILFIINPDLAMLLLWSIASSRGGGNSSGGDSGGGFEGGGGRSGGGGARGSW